MAHNNVTLKADFETATDIIRRVGMWRIGKGYDPGKTWKMTDLTNHSLLKSYPDRETYICIMLDGKPVGAVITPQIRTHRAWKALPGKRHIYVAKLCLLSEYQGQGYGDEVITILKNDCIAKGWRGIRLEVRSAGQCGLIKMYERNGFKRAGVSREMILFEWLS